MSAAKDYYKCLELSQNATSEEIKKAYHKQAKKWHPDKNSDNPVAGERFKEIKEAYDHLSDQNKRLMYDATHSRQYQPRYANQNTSTEKNNATKTPKFSFFTDFENSKNNKSSRNGAKSSFWSRYGESTFESFFPNEGSTFKSFFTFNSEDPTGSNNQKNEQRTPRSFQSKKSRTKSFNERPPWNNEFTESEPQPEPSFIFDPSDAKGGFAFHGGPFGWASFFDRYDPFFEPKPKSFEDVFSEFFPQSSNTSTNSKKKSENSEFPGFASESKPKPARGFSAYFPHTFESDQSDSDYKSEENEEKPGPSSFHPFAKSFRSTNDEEAIVSCKYCFTSMKVEQLIIHEKMCPLKPSSVSSSRSHSPDFDDDDARKSFYSDWQDAHSATINAIRRDKMKATRRDSEFSDGDMLGPDLKSVRCPYCKKSLPPKAASQHLPICNMKFRNTDSNSSYRSRQNMTSQNSKNAFSPNSPADEGSLPKMFPNKPHESSKENFDWLKSNRTPRKSDAGIYTNNSSSRVNSSKQRRSSDTSAFKSSKSPSLESDTAFKAFVGGTKFESRKSGTGRIGSGCKSCQKIFGKSRAPFLCSCGAKTGL